MHLRQLLSLCLQDTKLAILMELCQYGSFFKLIRMARQIKNMRESERIQVGQVLMVRLLISLFCQAESMRYRILGSKDVCYTAGLFRFSRAQRQLGLALHQVHDQDHMQHRKQMPCIICIFSIQAHFNLYGRHVLSLHQSHNTSALTA